MQTGLNWEGIVKSILTGQVSSTEPLDDDKRMIKIRKEELDVPVLLLNLEWGKKHHRVGVMPGTKDSMFCDVFIVALSSQSKSSDYNRSELLVILKNLTLADFINLMPEEDNTGDGGSTASADTGTMPSRIVDEIGTSDVAFIANTSNVENTSDIHSSDESSRNISHLDNPELKRIGSKARGKAIKYE